MSLSTASMPSQRPTEPVIRCKIKYNAQSNKSLQRRVQRHLRLKQQWDHLLADKQYMALFEPPETAIARFLSLEESTLQRWTSIMANVLFRYMSMHLRRTRNMRQVVQRSLLQYG